MMGKIHIIGGCLVAACALMVFGATNASADPEFFHCRKVVITKTGKYETKSKCEQLEALGTPEGEWEFGAYLGTEKTTFTASSGAVGFLAEGLPEVRCGKSAMEGEIIGPRSVKILSFVLTGCEAESFVKIACSSGAKEKEIVAGPLSGTVGYTRMPSESNETGIVLKPTTGENFLSFKCGEVPVTLKGEVIGVITPVAEMTNKFTLSFKEKSNKQEPESLLLSGETTTLMTGVHLRVEEKPASLTAVEAMANPEQLLFMF